MRLSQLILPWLVFGTAAGVVFFQADSRGQEPPKTDKEKLQGDCILTTVEARGIIAEIFGQVPEPARIRLVTFADEQMKLKVDRDSTIMSYQLDATATPKKLDLTIILGKDKKATLQGIYELDGKHLRMCFDSFGEARPSKFTVKAKDPEKPFGRLSMLTLRRKGADPKLDVLEQKKATCARTLGRLTELMQMHVEEHRAYPAAAISSRDGKPLLSWRVALLERLDQADLLKEFKTDEPWDSAHNKQLIKKMP